MSRARSSKARRQAAAAAVVAEARAWCGTRFHPQASAKGRGADCKGLVWGVARELGMPEAASFHAAIADYDLRRVPFALLREGMAAVFGEPVAAADIQPGDVLLLKFGGVPQHLAIVTEGNLDGGRAVHAQIKPRAWVKETDMQLLLHNFTFDTGWRFAACR